MKRGPKPKRIPNSFAGEYLLGASLYTLARRIGADETNVRNQLRQMGVQIRKPGTGKKSAPKKK